jgi:aryl-alcohol dehydrogenase-like predicted oxidoreductase
VDFVRLGATNLTISRLGFGTMGVGTPAWRSWVLDDSQAMPILERAIELGITFFDTSDFYSGGESEKVLGRAVKRLLPREEVVIATKVGNQMGRGPTAGGFSRKHILSAVDESLRRLDVDYIDLYQTHVWRPDTDIDEMLGAFQSLVEAGKIRYFGATDMPVWQFAKFRYAAVNRGGPAPVTMQHHYNLVWREHESELVPMCRAEGIGLLPYSPFARGFLTGGPAGHHRDTERGRTDDHARRWYGRPSDERVREALEQVASERGASAAAVALAWVLTKLPTATPLVGATAVDQLDAIDEALTLDLEPSELESLEGDYVARLSYGH